MKIKKKHKNNLKSSTAVRRYEIVFNLVRRMLKIRKLITVLGSGSLGIYFKIKKMSRIILIFYNSNIMK
jgi:hypothetical protein